MYELVQAAPNTFYIDCPAKIGVYRVSEDSVILIDSGNDKEAGKKVLKVLEANTWKPLAILNTHSNADHIGGNRLIQDRAGCPVYAPGLERVITCRPDLEPTFLYGAFPPKQLKNKFLMAQSSNALPLSAFSPPVGMEFVPLPGHFFDMMGVRTPDGVWFLADCLFAEAILEKYHVNFVYDVEAYLATLEQISQLEGTLFIPSHAPATADIHPLAVRNREKVEEIAAEIVLLCDEPSTPEEILRGIFRRYGLTMDFNQYVLVGSTVRSYLSYLADKGRIKAQFQDQMLYWSAK